MILSCDPEELSRLSKVELQVAILERRSAIRWHRGQILDDRCFYDDYALWHLLKDSPPRPGLISVEWGMGQCTLFYEYRRSDTLDPVPEGAILDPKRWDDDLLGLTEEGLLAKLVQLQKALGAHRDIRDRPRTIEDDRVLYQILPENLPADFRLPPREEFLGYACAPRAGCPSFWKSHGTCQGPHNLHQWGPCSGSSKSGRF